MLPLLSQFIIAGSACCSSGAFFPSIVSTSDKIQIGTTATAATVIGSSSSKGNAVFLNDEESDRSFSQNFFAGFRLSDEWQLGGSFSWFGREREVYTASEANVGFGDTYFHLTYEPLNNLSLTLTLLVPTAENPYESKEPLQSDAFGKGMWSPSIVLIFTEIVNRWDFHAQTSLRHSFGRSFDRPLLGDIDVEGIWGSSAVIGAGYAWNLADIRTGLSLGFHWDQGVQESDRFQKRSLAAKYVWDVVAEVSAPLPFHSRAQLSYRDQTLLGPTQNSELARSLSLSFSKAWSL